jgi:hypothetical protein
MMVLRRVQRWGCDAGDVAYTLGVAVECAVVYSGVISHPNERHPMNTTTANYLVICDECGEREGGYPIHGGDLLVCIECV